MHPSEPAIFTNMCMVYDCDGNVLVQNRADASWPGKVFPGGHVEPGETFAEAVIREVWEETGVTIRQPRLCGIKHYRTKRGERCVVLLYKTDQFEGQARSSDEGQVCWMPLDAFRSSPDLADGMATMLRLFLEDDLTEYTFRQVDDQWQDVLA